ncbi:MAG: hypothetical protein RL701_2920, partial [Pseudomonadota bacterium]
PSNADTKGPLAVPVAKFFDSLGVSAHIALGIDDAARSATALKYAGIRQLRDDTSAAAVPGLIAMHKSAGVRVALLTAADMTVTLAVAKQLREADALLAVEGPNEPQNNPVTYANQTSGWDSTFLPIAHFQRDLYAAVKAEPMLNTIPVFQTSGASGAQPDNVGLQYLTIPMALDIAMPAGTHYADFANTHNYVYGNKNVLVDNVAWQASDRLLNADWDGLYAEYGVTWRKQFRGLSTDELKRVPWVSTETGWTTSGRDNSITPEQQGRVYLDLYLSAFKQGVSYTFLYMLRDDPVHGYWGLFDTTYAAKASGTYVHNLTTILADAAGPAQPLARLDYAIAAPPATVHDLLFQKRDGAFALVVWSERFTGGNDDVVVNLQRPRASVKVFDPTQGVDPIQTLQDVSSVKLSLTDHPVVLQL